MPDPFPSTPMLTTFTCPLGVENPLSEDGAWFQSDPVRPPMAGYNSVGNCVASDSSHGVANYSSWVRNAFVKTPTNSVEAWICMEGGQLGAALETWRVALWTRQFDSLNGYLVYNGGALSKGTAIRRYTNGSFLDIASGGGPYPATLGIRISGTPPNQLISAYNDGVMVASVIDNTYYSGPFWISIAVEDPTSGGLSISCVGGGIPSRTQFFRWLHN